MLNINRSAGCLSSDGAPARGGPTTFYGYGIVAFIDLLGFSSEVQKRWSDDQKSPLAKLLRIKNAALRADTRILATAQDNPANKRVTMPRIHTVSDSLVISVAFDNPFNHSDLGAALMVALTRACLIWRSALVEGFTVRGAIEFGPIYWSPTETIGPAFQDAYVLESEVADWSRIIIGPSLSALVDMLRPPGYPHDPRVNMRSSPIDDLIEINPVGIFLQNFQPLIPPTGEIRKKYDPLLLHLTNKKPLKSVTNARWREGKAELIKRSWAPKFVAAPGPPGKTITIEPVTPLK